MDKKITFFNRHLRVGGVERVFVNLSNRLSEIGYDVDIAVAKEGGSMESDLSDKVNLVNLSRSRTIASIPPFIRYASRRKPDVIISGHDAINHALSLCNLFGLLDTCKFIASVHVNMSRLSQVDGVWYSRAIPWLVKWTYPFADEIVAVSEGVADDFQEMVGGLDDGVRVIYNPIVDDALREKAEEAVDHPWIADPSIPVVLGIGRAAPQKNFPLLIRAFEKVRKRADAKLMILGGGPELPAVKEEINDRGLVDHVELMGYVSNPYAYLAKASLYVLSSDFEGLPTTPIEALACGCPVVSTDCPSGPREILEDGKWGALVPVGDAEALADAMVDTLADPPDSSKLKERAEAFSVDTAVDKYREVFFPT